MAIIPFFYHAIPFQSTVNLWNRVNGYQIVSLSSVFNTSLASTRRWTSRKGSLFTIAVFQPLRKIINILEMGSGSTSGAIIDIGEKHTPVMGYCSNSSAVVSKDGEQIMTMIMWESEDLDELAGLLTTSVKKEDQVQSVDWENLVGIMKELWILLTAVKSQATTRVLRMTRNDNLCRPKLLMFLSKFCEVGGSFVILVMWLGMANTISIELAIEVVSLVRAGTAVIVSSPHLIA
ncbi:hypothetical protein Tco_0546390 [Tanacetum coccineum]